MRLHNFFIEETIGDQSHIEISGSDLIHQWRHVFRFNTGSIVVLFDNSGFEYEAQFTELTYLKAALVILEKRKNKFSPKKEIILFQSLIKTDKFEWILEKSTELGVSSFQPILSERSVAKKINMIRAKKILKESAEQSGRGILPALSEPVSLAEALQKVDPTNSFVLDPLGSPFSTGNFNLKSYNCFLGPEGGFTERELKLFQEKNIPIISFGSQILRAETAAVAIAALLLL